MKLYSILLLLFSILVLYNYLIKESFSNQYTPIVNDCPSPDDYRDASGICLWESGKIPNNKSCSKNIDCSSNYCDNNICSPLPFTKIGNNVCVDINENKEMSRYYNKNNTRDCLSTCINEKDCVGINSGNMGCNIYASSNISNLGTLYSGSRMPTVNDIKISNSSWGKLNNYKCFVKNNDYKPYIDYCNGNKNYFNFSNASARLIGSNLTNCKQQCLKNNNCDAYLINPSNNSCYNWSFYPNNISKYQCSNSFSNGRWYGQIKKTSSNKIQKNPIDCQVSKWGNWGGCSKTCNTGYKRRFRTIISQPKYGGKKCPYLIDITSCNKFPCINDMWKPFTENGSWASYITINNKYMYAISNIGSVWKTNLQGNNWTQIAEPNVKQIFVYNDVIYGVSNNNSIIKTSSLENSYWYTVSNSTYVSYIYIYQNIIYAIGYNGSIYKVPISGGNLTQITNTQYPLTQIVCYHNDIYGIGIDKQIYKTSISGGKITLLPNSCCVTNIVLFNNNIYGVGTDGNIYLYLSNSFHKLLNGWLSQIVIYDKYIYGIGTKKQIWKIALPDNIVVNNTTYKLQTIDTKNGFLPGGNNLPGWKGKNVSNWNQCIQECQNLNSCQGATTYTPSKCWLKSVNTNVYGTSPWFSWLK